jgi:23S rRNA (adenine2503-C2)-methyltransferase
MVAGEEDWEGGPGGRAPVCISTQAGCAMGCTFCATGQFGFTRHLSVGEVVEQVARVSTMLPALRPGPGAPDHLTNVVFMGMGEPFANQEATWGAAHRLHQGFGLSARAITISTVGLVPGIRRAAAEPLGVNLAVGIDAACGQLRTAAGRPGRGLADRGRGRRPTAGPPADAVGPGRKVLPLAEQT